MDVRSRTDGEALEEIVHQLGLEIAHADDLHSEIHGGVRPAAEIDGRDRQRLVHRHHEVARAVDPAARAQRLRHRLAERDAEIFHGVMLIDVEIADRVDPQIERAVPGDEFQHVIEKADAGADRVLPFAVEADGEHNLRLGGPPIDHRTAHSTSSITATARRVCSTMPAPTRMQPAQPGSVERSRM